MMVFYGQSQTVTGDIVNRVNLGYNGWVALAWDGTNLLAQNETDGNWLYIDKNTGTTTPAFNNPEGGNVNVQGLAWSPTRNTYYTLQFGVNQGEVWELNTDGTVANVWDANIFNPNRQRGLTIVDEEVWIGQANENSDPPNEFIFRFDLDGNQLGVISLVGGAVSFSRDMEWVNGQLWINDNAGAVIRVYDYDPDDLTLTQVRMFPRQHFSQFGLAFTGTEVLSAGWNYDQLLWIQADEKVLPAEEGAVGDTIFSVPGYFSTALAWDGEFAWGLSEDDNQWHQFDKSTGATGVTFANPTDALSWAQGAAWSSTNNSFFTNQSGLGDGEVWEINKNGEKVNSWSTGLGNDIRGLAIRNDEIWITIIGSDQIYRFGLSGNRLEDVSLDVPILFSGGIEWVDDEQLWVNDRDGQHIAVYDFDEDNLSLTKVKSFLLPFSSYWGMAYTGDEMLAAGWGTDILYGLRTGQVTTATADASASSLKANIYPNPFYHTTSIDVSLEKSGPVVLQVFDLGGQKIDEVRYEHIAQGDHTFQWKVNESTAIPGSYFIKLVSGDGSAVMHGMRLR